MSIANQLAHPSPVAWNPHHGKVEPSALPDGSGLTKRQHIAIEMLKALVANPEVFTDVDMHQAGSYDNTIESAVKLADALIAKLDAS